MPSPNDDSTTTATTTAVLLPGTGSDDIFVRTAFHRPLSAAGVTVVTPHPKPGPRLAPWYLSALDDAADTAGAPILVGGVSFGAHLAATWALHNPTRCAGLLAVLPAWHGPADEGSPAPAAIAARASAELVRERGVAAALDIATADVPDWLAAELRRAWRRQAAWLGSALDEAAAHPAPSLRALTGIHIPTGVVACLDDPVHPAAVATAWADALPCSGIEHTTLEAIGADRANLGLAALTALRRARQACWAR